MLRILTLQRNRRLAWLRNGQLVRIFGPGRWLVWTGFGVNEWLPIDVTAPIEPIVDGDPLPDEAEGMRTVRVGPTQRLVLAVDGVVRQILGPGRYRLWDGRDRFELRWFDAHSVPIALDEADRLPEPAEGWTEAAASDQVAVVLYRDGAPVRVLAPGRYRAWDGGPWALGSVGLSLQPLEVAAQDVVTADQVPVRVKPGVACRIVDPVRRLREARALDLAYGAVQLALREIVASLTLDELVGKRAALSRDLLARARDHLPEVGIALEAVFVKDLILPGEIKDLVNRVTLARKEAEANAIKRRQEVASTRQLANTAKLLESNPILLRLKELEAMGELADRIDKLVVVGGAELARQVLRGEASG